MAKTILASARSGQWAANLLHAVGFPLRSGLPGLTWPLIFPDRVRVGLVLSSFNSLAKVRAELDPHSQVLIVSVLASDTSDEAAMKADYVRTALLAKRAGGQIVELNYSCPNVRGDPAGEVYQNPARAGRIAEAVKQALGDTPLFVKIGYLPAPTLREFFEETYRHIDGIVAINTISAPIIDKDGKPTFGENRPTAGVSGFAIKPWAWDVNRNLVQLRSEYQSRLPQPMTLIALGGVLTPQDVQDYLDLGVDAVESCTGAFLNPNLGLETRSQSASIEGDGQEVKAKIKEPEPEPITNREAPEQLVSTSLTGSHHPERRIPTSLRIRAFATFIKQSLLHPNSSGRIVVHPDTGIVEVVPDGNGERVITTRR